MKKIYIAPKAILVEIESTNILAGSGTDSFNNQVTSASALGKRNNGWDEDEDY